MKPPRTGDVMQMIEYARRNRSMSTYAPGDYVKAEFRDDKSGESEWM